MGKVMKRQDRQISFEKAVRILENYNVGVLSTIDAEGQPYGVPLNYVYLNDCIYFHCGLEGHKLDNIKYNNKVSFSVYGRDEIIPEKFSTRYESVIIFGRAIIVEEEEKYQALVEFINRFSPDYFDKGIKYIKADMNKCLVVKIIPEEITAKAANLM